MSDKPTISNALSHYKENMGEDLKALWKIWIPTTFLNFAFMPLWGRIPWVAGTSFLWSMVLSMMRGGAITDGDELAADLTGSAVTGESLHLFGDSLNDYLASPVDLDKTQIHMCVSASGPDKVGWVSMLARAVSDHGGNVTHSKMIRLGKEFTVLMHVSVAPKDRKNIIAGLYSHDELEPLNLKISGLTRRQTGMFVEPTLALTIHCVGKDRPGMLAEVAEKLSGRGISVENLSTELRRGPGGRRDFVINANVTCSGLYDQDELKTLFADMRKLKKKLNLDVLDIRAQKI